MNFEGLYVSPLSTPNLGDNNFEWLYTSPSSTSYYGDKKMFNDFVLLLEQLKDQLFILGNEFYKMARAMSNFLQNHEAMGEKKLIMKNFHAPLMVETTVITRTLITVLVYLF